MVGLDFRRLGLALLAVSWMGCGGTPEEGRACNIEGAEVCSSDASAILVCEDGELRELEACGQGMECQQGADGPECVPVTIEPTRDIECAADGLNDFNAYLNGLIRLLKAVDNPAVGLPPLYFINWDEGGEFGAQVDTGPDGVTETMSGVIRPLSCEGGMFPGDVCIFEWAATRPPSIEEIAFATMSANRIDMSDATRYTIVDRNPEVIHDEACQIEVTAFNMMWFVRRDQMYSLQLDFLVYLDGSTTSALTGFVIWASEATEPFYWTSGDDRLVPITFQRDGDSFECEMSLRTFEVTCNLA